jgi:hypothetical protein
MEVAYRNFGGCFQQQLCAVVGYLIQETLVSANCQRQSLAEFISEHKSVNQIEIGVIVQEFEGVSLRFLEYDFYINL